METAISNWGSGPDLAWYALYTRHQHEKAVARILSNKGFHVFLPLYTAAHRWKDRAKQLSLPLFPGYVFICGGLNRRLEIVTTPGVHGFAESGGKPWVIPEEEIEALRQIIERGMRVEPYPMLKCGNWVRVKCGPLAGAEGILLHAQSLSRLVLSVGPLEKSVAVEVDISTVERVA